MAYFLRHNCSKILMRFWGSMAHMNLDSKHGSNAIAHIPYTSGFRMSWRLLSAAVFGHLSLHAFVPVLPTAPITSLLLYRDHYQMSSCTMNSASPRPLPAIRPARHTLCYRSTCLGLLATVQAQQTRVIPICVLSINVSPVIQDSDYHSSSAGMKISGPQIKSAIELFFTSKCTISFSPIFHFGMFLKVI